MAAKDWFYYMILFECPQYFDLRNKTKIIECTLLVRDLHVMTYNNLFRNTVSPFLAREIKDSLPNNFLVVMETYYGVSRDTEFLNKLYNF